MKSLVSLTCMTLCLVITSNAIAVGTKGEIRRFWVSTNGTTNFVIVSLIDPSNITANLHTNPNACPQTGYFSLESSSPFYETAMSTLLTAKAISTSISLNVTGCSNNGYPSFNNIDFE
ncbi:MAG: hypothetical protein KUG79_14005 [Pseudomonadales bacterium]|nr:hypothetical protein [Pseudomonadales bacterium]